jgi:hypothetical protein
MPRKFFYSTPAKAKKLGLLSIYKFSLGLTVFFGVWWMFALSMEVLEEISVPDLYPDVLSFRDPDPYLYGSGSFH